MMSSATKLDQKASDSSFESAVNSPESIISFDFWFSFINIIKSTTEANIYPSVEIVLWI